MNNYVRSCGRHRPCLDADKRDSRCDGSESRHIRARQCTQLESNGAIYFLTVSITGYAEIIFFA
jgi:hypothetical protein